MSTVPSLRYLIFESFFKVLVSDLIAFKVLSLEIIQISNVLPLECPNFSATYSNLNTFLLSTLG